MSDRLRERPSSAIGARVRETARAYNPHLGDRVAGVEYKPKYTHQQLDVLVERLLSEPRHALFHGEGPVVVGVSDPDVSAAERHYSAMTIDVDDLTSGTVTVRVLVDGVVITGAAVSAVAANDPATVAVSVHVPALAELAIEVTSAGTGGAGLVVVLE